MPPEIAFCKIHPAIGIARAGNSPTGFFVGPEIPGVAATPVGGYKDTGDMSAGIPPRVKRQAARFRIYAYASDGSVLDEVTLGDAEIGWSVHLVNGKAEGDRFAGKEGEQLPLGQRRPRETWRNADIEDRASLVIDPGPRSVAGPNQRAQFDGGKFRGIDVPLGGLRTDEAGRLLVLGGFGKSGASNPGQPISDYANNDRWYDDVSDGPVTATVTLRSGRSVSVVPAWVIVAPPDFAPAVVNSVTLYDVAVDVASRHRLGPVPVDAVEQPSFTRDIAPIFDRLAALGWVQSGARGAGPSANAFSKLDEIADAGAERRNAIFGAFRNPYLEPTSDEAKAQATGDFVPALSGDSGDARPGKPEFWLSLTRTQYDLLSKWRDGLFVNDWAGAFPAPARGITPAGLDRAALEACAGGAFYPGIEGGWLLRNPEAYSEPFRLAHDRLKPGDVTRRMACPWQADFFECKWHWWPAQRPDEVLTNDAYRRLREVEEELQQLDPTSPAHAQLQSERTLLMAERQPWARGLPPESYDGDRAMIERWAELGFVVAADQDGERFTLPDGRPACVETERGRYDGLSWPEYFHVLTNIEQHPQFLPKARELAHAFFAGAKYDAAPFYQPFEYTPEAFDRRLQAIYDSYVREMNERSRLDTGLIQWPVVVRYEGDREVTKLVTFDVGRFSDRAVKERLRQRAPFNLTDGAWLQRIQSAGPIDEIRAHLFAIWDDEAGNGRTEQNHCNVYDTLLRSLNIYMPPITARRFIEQDLLPSAFIQPVFQLAVGLSPEEFFPEILGMTLYLEWEASPSLTPTVRHYRDRGIDPHFYSLHVAIDNITAGHGFLAKEAVKRYLQKVEDEGGSAAMREAWRRIWAGYVTWATAGDLGRDLLELCMIIDRKQINLSYPDMLLPEHIADPAALVVRLQAAARGTAPDLLATYLVKRFQPNVQKALRDHRSATAPAQALTSDVVDELNRLVQSEESFFTTERFAGVRLGGDTSALITKAPSGEQLVRLNRLLLRDGFAGVVRDIPELAPRWFPDYRSHFESKFVDLVRRKTYAAKPLHRRVVVGSYNLAELFDSPAELARVLATSDLIDIQHPRSSRFFDALSFSGPMYKVFTEDEKTLILDWIESLQGPSRPRPPAPGPTPSEWGTKVLELIRNNAATAVRVDRHAQYSVEGRSLKDWFNDPQGLLAAFARSPEWVVRGDSGLSRLYTEFATGRMSFMGPTVAATIKNWIDSGAEVPQVTDEVVDEAVVSLSDAPLRQHAADFTGLPDAVVEASVAVMPAVRVEADREFVARRRLTGMGAVH